MISLLVCLVMPHLLDLHKFRSLRNHRDDATSPETGLVRLGQFWLIRSICRRPKRRRRRQSVALNIRPFVSSVFAARALCLCCVNRELPLKLSSSSISPKRPRRHIAVELDSVVFGFASISHAIKTIPFKYGHFNKHNGSGIHSMKKNGQQTKFVVQFKQEITKINKYCCPG